MTGARWVAPPSQEKRVMMRKAGYDDLEDLKDFNGRLTGCLIKERKAAQILAAFFIKIAPHVDSDVCKTALAEAVAEVAQLRRRNT